MNLTYIFHSGYMLEAKNCILIFDFWKDAANKVVQHKLAETHKRVYFLASHFHQDHFNPEILSMQVPKGEKKIILSCDIYRRRRADKQDATAFLRKGESYTDDFLSIHAFGSTDSGVSFLVELEGINLFHAGDLNNWHWESESTEQEVRKMEGDFKAILNEIKIKHPRTDLTLFPVDPRLGNDFYRGARQWLETIPTRFFAPMHFEPAYAEAMTFGPQAESLGTKFLAIHHQGEQIASLEQY